MKSTCHPEHADVCRPKGESTIGTKAGGFTYSTFYSSKLLKKSPLVGVSVVFRAEKHEIIFLEKSGSFAPHHSTKFQTGLIESKISLYKNELP